MSPIVDRHHLIDVGLHVFKRQVPGPHRHQTVCDGRGAVERDRMTGGKRCRHLGGAGGLDANNCQVRTREFDRGCDA
jgi:hypothetical protein